MQTVFFESKTYRPQNHHQILLSLVSSGEDRDDRLSTGQQNCYALNFLQIILLKLLE